MMVMIFTMLRVVMISMMIYQALTIGQHDMIAINILSFAGVVNVMINCLKKGWKWFVLWEEKGWKLCCNCFNWWIGQRKFSKCLAKVSDKGPTNHNLPLMLSYMLLNTLLNHLLCLWFLIGNAYFSSGLSRQGPHLTSRSKWVGEPDKDYHIMTT